MSTVQKVIVVIVVLAVGTILLDQIIWVSTRLMHDLVASQHGWSYSLFTWRN